jgi:hypothetical protein
MAHGPRLEKQWCSFCHRNIDWQHGDTPVSYSNLGVYACGRRQCIRYMHAFNNDLRGSYNQYYGKFRSFPQPTIQHRRLS